MSKFNILLGIFLALSANLAAAQSHLTGPVKIVNVTNVVGTASNPVEAILVKTDEATITNPAGCSFLYSYYLDASNISRSMVLAALASNATVEFNLSQTLCSSDNRPIIVKLTVHAP